MKRIAWANSLRGVAAVSVVIWHLSILFWVSQTTASGLARRDQLWTGSEGAPGFASFLGGLPFDFAAFGVGLFFLLSGYVIAISLTRYNRRGFLVGRLMRILPTYAVGYLITCAVVWIAGDPRGELNVPSVLIGMVPGLGPLINHPVPADGIVWTLTIEMVFYTICLLAYRWLTSAWQCIALIAFLCFTIQTLMPLPPINSPLRGFAYVVLLACPFIPVMLVGVVLSAHHRNTMSLRSTQLLVPALALTSLYLTTTGRITLTTAKYDLMFTATIAAFVAISIWGSAWRGNRGVDFFAEVSYPLYVVHVVLGYTILSVLTSLGVWPLVAIVIAFSAVLGTAYLLHIAVEMPTHRRGQRWARRIGHLASRPPGDTVST